jgi:hypothetical protein
VWAVGIECGLFPWLQVLRLKTKAQMEKIKKLNHNNNENEQLHTLDFEAQS